MSHIERIKVTPVSVTVLGFEVKANSPAWRGLDLKRAEPRQQSSLMLSVLGHDSPLDIHLNVPFQHPEDTISDDVFYRVRPRMEVGKKYNGKIVKSVAFERWGDDWFIALELMPPMPERRGLTGEESMNESNRIIEGKCPHCARALNIRPGFDFSQESRFSMAIKLKPGSLMGAATIGATITAMAETIKLTANDLGGDVLLFVESMHTDADGRLDIDFLVATEKRPEK